MICRHFSTVYLILWLCVQENLGQRNHSAFDNNIINITCWHLKGGNNSFISMTNKSMESIKDTGWNISSRSIQNEQGPELDEEKLTLDGINVTGMRVNISQPTGRGIMNVFRNVFVRPVLRAGLATVGLGVQALLIGGDFIDASIKTGILITRNGIDMMRRYRARPSPEVSTKVILPFVPARSIEGNGSQGPESSKITPLYMQPSELAMLERAAEIYLESVEANLSASCAEGALELFNKAAGSVGDADADDTDNEQDEEDEEEEKGILDVVTEEVMTKFVHWKQFSKELQREIRLLMKEADGLVDKPILDEEEKISKSMSDAYKAASVCMYGKNCSCKTKEESNCLKVEPDISKILSNSRNPDELKYYWVQWHDTVGKAISPKEFLRFLELRNKIAQFKGFRSETEFWLDDYDDWTPGWTAEKFKKLILELWNELKPYYKILHAYVRMKLSEHPNYKLHIKRCGFIPAHLIGNMFGQSWTALTDLIKPFPDAPSVDASASMKKNGYTPRKMVEIADDFYISLGLKPLPASFWKHSIYEKPPGRNMECHPSALDMCKGRKGFDYRLSMCAEVNQRDFQTIHHELGHIQYMIQFRTLRKALRDAINPGFDESIGDVLAMSAMTPEHLQCYLKLDLGLGIDCESNAKDNYEVTPTDINFLFAVALESLSFFPFALAMDMWRWELIEGKITLERFNDRWWEIRTELQGIIPPVKRPNNIFDAAAKYHTVEHKSYISYFLSTIYQYDFNEALCKAAGQYNPQDKKGKPIYKCDITGSKAAGALLRNVLKMGKRRPWTEALLQMTGHQNITTAPLLTYLAPLFPKLKEMIKAGNQEDCLEKDWVQ